MQPHPGSPSDTPIRHQHTKQVPTMEPEVRVQVCLAGLICGTTHRGQPGSLTLVLSLAPESHTSWLSADPSLPWQFIPSSFMLQPPFISEGLQRLSPVWTSLNSGLTNQTIDLTFPWMSNRHFKRSVSHYESFTFHPPLLVFLVEGHPTFPGAQAPINLSAVPSGQNPANSPHSPCRLPGSPSLSSLKSTRLLSV